MENENILDLNNQSSAASLSITEAAMSYLRETAGWGKFLGIMGFILTGLMALLGLFMGAFMQTMTEAMGQDNPLGPYIGFIYVVLGLLYFFPSLYLFKYSSKLKRALSSKDSQVLTEAFSNEKSMYKFMGILMIILLGIYALIFVVGIVAAMFAA